MCTNPDGPWRNFDGTIGEGYGFDVLTQRIKKIKKNIDPSEAIILTGGETTLHPRFLDILKFVRKTFPKQEVRVLTNGRSFFYRDFTKRVLETKNLNLAISLYGPTAKIHDTITRTKNGFEQTIRGIENVLACRGEDQSVEIRTVVTKLSYKHINEILNLISLKFPSIDRVIVIFMEIEGQAIKNKKASSISYSKVKPYIKKTYQFLNILREIRFYHFPLCMIEPKFWPSVWRTLPNKEVSYISVCDKCKYKKYCLGIHNEYLKNIGDKEFKPIKKDLIIQETNNYYHPIAGLEINDI